MTTRAKSGGRTKGTPNKLTAALKDMILVSLDNAGGVDYLTQQASQNPAAFLQLIGKVLPLQVTGANGGAILIATGVQRPEETAAPDGD